MPRHIASMLHALEIAEAVRRGLRGRDDYNLADAWLRRNGTSQQRLRDGIARLLLENHELQRRLEQAERALKRATDKKVKPSE
jgi:hypothetical protein